LEKSDTGVDVIETAAGELTFEKFTVEEDR